MVCVDGRFLVRVQVHSVAWNCSGKKLASGSVDQTARIWHVEPHGHVRTPFLVIVATLPLLCE